MTPAGLGTLDHPHPLQEAFADLGAVQCGYCTAGLIIAAKALLDQNPHPTEEEIQEAISGNLCRCTGYGQIVEAVQVAAAKMRDELRGSWVSRATGEEVHDDVQKSSPCPPSSCPS